MGFEYVPNLNNKSMDTICICGGGSLGHVIAGFLCSRNKIKVNVLTRNPALWNYHLETHTPEKTVLKGELNLVSDNPAKVISGADIVLLCLPGFSIKNELLKIKPFIKNGAFVGSVFSSTGFFFEALKIFDDNIPLWGFQRVPFISRVKEYGKCANLLGYKSSYNIAVENSDNKEMFRIKIEDLFERPTHLLNNYYEASFTNSNPLLHPARLYSLFKDWNPQQCYDHNFLFYGEWSNEASKLLIEMDKELFNLLAVLPVAKDYLQPILEYYESYDAESLTNKINSIESLSTIISPMIQVKGGWIPDFKSRYFQEDFPFGLKYIRDKAKEMEIETSTIDMVYEWGISRI